MAFKLFKGFCLDKVAALFLALASDGRSGVAGPDGLQKNLMFL